MADALERGRDAVERRAWAEAYAQLAVADEDAALARADLEHFAFSAYLAGHDVHSGELMARLYHEWSNTGDRARAAHVAFWLGMALMYRGEHAQAGGWFARARGVLEGGDECVVHGLLMIPAALQSMYAGDARASYDTFTDALAIGNRFGDPDLMTLGRLGCGQSLLRLDHVAEGVTLLDEAMVAVTANEVSPMVAGIVYCEVIAACNALFDLRRAQEWTIALGHWCDAQAGLVPFRGNCLVHRSEIMQLRGMWAEALDEAERARERFTRPSVQPAIGLATYQLAELHRLRGERGLAESEYLEAGLQGHDVQPGLALLRLAQGRFGAAQVAIGRALDETADRSVMPKLLAAAVEIAVAAGDVEGARDAADQLGAIATSRAAPVLEAMAAYASGSVLLAEGDARSAASELRQAWRLWEELGIPYEAARARVLIGVACRELGDDDGARMAVGAARRTFADLGAAPDLARVDRTLGHAPTSSVGGLSPRELDVLRLVAAGLTNRAIAAELVLSEKTIARHVSNIFVKLGVTSRSAATAFAYDQHIVGELS